MFLGVKFWNLNKTVLVAARKAIQFKKHSVIEPFFMSSLLQNLSHAYDPILLLYIWTWMV